MGNGNDDRRARAILNGLDPSQRAAAQAIAGPVRIMAVAGAGKTRTITRRIAYACATGAWNERKTVAVTFSVKAARQMQERLRKLGVTEAKTATFHSLALSQLRQVWRELVGTEFPQISNDPAKLAAQAVEEVTHTPGVSRREAQDVLGEISWTKVSLIASDDYERVCAAFHRQPPAGLSPADMAAVIQAYERVKSAANSIDFSDILLILCHLMETSEEAAQMVRGSIGWLTVDEYQDVSPLQHRLISLWMGLQPAMKGAAGGRSRQSSRGRRSLPSTANTNICVVGDPAQTIYSFAGATSWYLQDFVNEFPQLAADIKLAVDYRSAGSIIACANQILETSPHASGYVHLLPREGAQQGAAVRLHRFSTDEEEARQVADHVRQMIDSGANPNEIAVLTRINSQLGAFCRAFDDAGIPYALRRASANQSEDSASEPQFSKAVREGVANGTIESLNTPMAMLSTIHAAKGLEWDHVFVAGASEGLIPYTSAKTDEEIEEERRLLYVAVTRGRESVDVSYAERKDATAFSQRSLTRFLSV